MKPGETETPRPREGDLSNTLSLLRVAVMILAPEGTVERKLGLKPSYLQSLLSGEIDLTLAHIHGICAALDLEPAEFFAVAYPGTPRHTRAGAHLRDMIRRTDPKKESAPLPPLLRIEASDPWRVAELQKAVEAAVGSAVQVWINTLTEEAGGKD
jgi:transcriptional regulator with XRE-family HTH domain